MDLQEVSVRIRLASARVRQRLYYAMKNTIRARARAIRFARWVAPLYAAMLLTVVVDAAAQPFDEVTSNVERARIRKLGNIIGLTLLGALLTIPVIAVIRHQKSARDLAADDAE